MKAVILESEWNAELSSGKSDFVAIAGHLHLMKHGHVDTPLNHDAAGDLYALSVNPAIFLSSVWLGCQILVQVLGVSRRTLGEFGKGNSGNCGFVAPTKFW
jgi:hypothetical protein